MRWVDDVDDDDDDIMLLRFDMIYKYNYIALLES